MTDQTVTKDETEKTTGLRNRKHSRRNKIIGGLCLLLVCLTIVAVVPQEAWAQVKTKIKYVPCAFCGGTGKNLCSNCHGTGCAQCNFSGVLPNRDWMFCDAPNQFACCFCKGRGKVEVVVDPRFENKCFDLGSLKRKDGSNTYRCLGGEYASQTVIVDKIGGNIIKRYETESGKIIFETREERVRRERLEQEQARLEEERVRQVKPYIDDWLKQHIIFVKGGTFTYYGTYNVTLDNFAIGRYEVTQALYASVMGSVPDRYDGDNLPVTKVNWNAIQTFIKKLNLITGKQYRLPTEAEWLYAARGGAMSKGYKYSGSNNLNDVAWYRENSKRTIHIVGGKLPNELGLHDMSGNVWEWTDSHIKDYYFRTRGCGYDDAEENCILSSDQNLRDDKTGSKYMGFRLAITLSPAEEAEAVERARVEMAERAAEQARIEAAEQAARQEDIRSRSGTFTDKRDGRTYKTIKIGNKTWMAENLNYKKGQSSGTYDWKTAKKVCPAGFHLPSREEWYLVTGKDFSNVGKGSKWWTATEYVVNKNNPNDRFIEKGSRAYYLSVDRGYFSDHDDKSKSNYVRCVQD